jgi:hypothetical protein
VVRKNVEVDRDRPSANCESCLMTDTSLSSRALAFVVAIMSEKLTLWLISYTSFCDLPYAL